MSSPIQFDPTSLAKYGRLALVARSLVEGFLTGAHKSPYKGFSVEFAEHRQYYPGDEIRHIDWRAYGKTDRYYIKEYEEETNLKAHLLVDASGSMAFQSKAAPGPCGERVLSIVVRNLALNADYNFMGAKSPPSTPWPVESAARSWWRILRSRSSCSQAPACSSEAGGT